MLAHLQLPSHLSVSIDQATSIQDLVAGCGTKWTCEQLVIHYATKALDLDERLNLISELFVDEALLRAQQLDKHMKETASPLGPLHGLVIVLSDEAHICGHDTTLGCVCGSFQPIQQDAFLVKQLKDLGAIPILKTSVPWHLLFGDTSSPLYGTALHRERPVLSLGGRCGSLGQMVAGSVLCGFGTDTIGGLRGPSNHANLYCLKPTLNRLSFLTLQSTWDTLESVPGPMTRSLQDLTHLFRVMVSCERKDPTIVPLPFDNLKYESSLQKTMTIGYVLDDDIMRASPACKRAVMRCVRALTEQGHTLVPVKIPDSQGAMILLSKLYSPSKVSKQCMNPKLKEMTTSLSPLMPMLIFMKLPKLTWNLVASLVSRILDDPLIAQLAYSFGGQSLFGYKPKTEDSLIECTGDRKQYCRLFSQTWESLGLDCMITPVHACPPAPVCSSSLIWPGSLYSSLFSLVDHPVGVIPNVTQVERNDFITNVIHYAHNQRFQWRHQVRGKHFKFLGVMGLEELNHAIHDRSILGVPVGVQVVGKRFQEEELLATMRIIQESIE
ncbi:amidase signature domain-containing protein [Gorgonomyces haynaldii]|nr:amidase signature domain-containing protein [Gorgonomyces haynaldii]